MRFIGALTSVCCILLLAAPKVLPQVKPKGIFRMERVKTGEVVATLDGMVIGFGPDAYSTTYEYGKNAFGGIPFGAGQKRYHLAEKNDTTPNT
jgi:hypothetical protein